VGLAPGLANGGASRVRVLWGEDRGADDSGWGVKRGGCEESGMWGLGMGVLSPLGTGLGGAVPPPQKKN